MKIIIGTKNKSKLDVTLDVFKSTLDIEDVVILGYNAKSSVPEAPLGEETYIGALNRARECHSLGSADYSVGIESGLVKRYGNMFEEAWAVVIASDGKEYIGYSSGLLLPPIVASRMSDGEKHNDIMAHFDKEFDLPDDNRDTWSRYTGGNISRRVSLEEALRNAIIQIASSGRNLYNYR